MTTLTPRELQVHALHTIHQMTPTEIADILGISRSTVKTYLERITQKETARMNVHRSTERERELEQQIASLHAQVRMLGAQPDSWAEERVEELEAGDRVEFTLTAKTKSTLRVFVRWDVA